MSIVVKFGGTSVANKEQIHKTLDIVSQRIDKGVVLVASAMGKTTDRLVDIIQIASEGHRARGISDLNELREEHLAQLQGITDHHDRLHAVKRIELLCDEMQEVCSEISGQHAATDAQRAYFTAHGELLATTVVYALALAQGMPCTLLDSREFIKTETDPLQGEVKWEESEALIKECIPRKANMLYIAQGFIASSADGRTTTLGRGGSDYTAALIGAALSVDIVEIWTDVDGILTTDPRIIQSARPIEALNYNEAAELAYFGAKVIHPRTMVPVIQRNIPLIVRNVNNPEHRGTLIRAQKKQSGVKAIAVKQGITVIHIRSERMLNAYGVLSQIFAIFATYKKPVDLIATSEVSVSLTIDDTGDIEEIIEKLQAIAQVEMQENQGIVSVVAQGLWQDAGAVARVFDALADKIPIRLVSLGGSDTNLSLVIEQKYISDAVKRLHHAFFES